MNRLDWFTSRIGKRVFRNRIDGIEDSQYLFGVVVMSERHAKGLAELESESIKYFDSKKEAKEFII